MESKVAFEKIRDLVNEIFNEYEVATETLEYRNLTRIIEICNHRIDRKTLRDKIDDIGHFRKHHAEVILKDADTGKMLGINDMRSIGSRLLDMEFVRATPETKDRLMTIYVRSK